MLEFLQRFFAKDSGSSKQVAKERLRLVLVHDRSDISPHLLESLKEDLIAVITKYMEIDKQALEVSFNSSNDAVALVANIPVIKLKRAYQVS
ncbi:MAG: cell division topological specificity factor MinE [Bacillota bacterium]